MNKMESSTKKKTFNIFKPTNKIINVVEMLPGGHVVLFLTFIHILQQRIYQILLPVHYPLERLTHYRYLLVSFVGL